MPHCKVAPLGMLSQSTITEDGTREPKLCLTNDQSFNSQKGEKRSLDNRVESNSLMPARFGRALIRIMLHYICWLSNRFPKERLLMTKVDCKSTYCRVASTLTTNDCPKVVHLYRGDTIGRALDGVRRGAKPVAVERRVGDGRGPGQ